MWIDESMLEFLAPWKYDWIFWLLTGTVVYFLVYAGVQVWRHRREKPSMCPICHSETRNRAGEVALSHRGYVVIGIQAGDKNEVIPGLATRKPELN